MATQLILRVARPNAVLAARLAVLLHAELVHGQNLSGPHETRLLALAHLAPVARVHKIIYTAQLARLALPYGKLDGTRHVVEVPAAIRASATVLHIQHDQVGLVLIGLVDGHGAVLHNLLRFVHEAVRIRRLNALANVLAALGAVQLSQLARSHGGLASRTAQAHHHTPVGLEECHMRVTEGGRGMLAPLAPRLADPTQLDRLAQLVHHLDLSRLE